MLVLLKTHPLAEKAAHGDCPVPLPLRTLEELDLLLPLPGTALHDEIDAELAHEGVQVHPSMELDGVRLIASLTLDGYGPAILPASSISGAMRERVLGAPPARHLEAQGRYRRATPRTPVGAGAGRDQRAPRHNGRARPDPRGPASGGRSGLTVLRAAALGSAACQRR